MEKSKVTSNCVKVIKKKKKFRLLKMPRYLPGSVPRDTWKNDLKEYNKFRYKCFTVSKKIDDNPPQMNPYNYLKKTAFLDDRERLITITKENRNLLKKINIINRTHGRVDCFNPFAYADQSKWKSHEDGMKIIDKFNKEIYKQIMAVTSVYNTKEMDAQWLKILQRLKEMCMYPLVIVEKKKTYDDILETYPSISSMEQEGERLHCFMDFQIKDSLYLGRIIVELYHDHVPVTVQNFLAICRGENGLSYKNCFVHNIAKGQYIESGDITKNNGKGGTSIYGETFDEENFTLKHSRAGVLSMISVKPGQNNSQFCITLKEMEKFDGKRVVFGKIVRGNETIFKIQDMGRRLGKPVEPIYISSCGEYTPKIKNIKPVKPKKKPKKNAAACTCVQRNKI